MWLTDVFLTIFHSITGQVEKSLAETDRTHIKCNMGYDEKLSSLSNVSFFYREITSIILHRWINSEDTFDQLIQIYEY